VIERRSRAALVSVLLASAASISAAIWFICPEVVEYRGLSGIDSGLFAFAALAMYYDIRSANQRGAAWILLALSFAFVGKVVFEAATGSTIFVNSPAAGFTPLPITHAIGAASGVFVWLTIGRRLRQDPLHGLAHRGYVQAARVQKAVRGYDQTVRIQ
jgi:hypothetical protein